MAVASRKLHHPRQRAPGIGYEPRRPEQTVLYGVVQEHLETFLARRQDQGRPVPRFVERELRGFLECGNPDAVRKILESLGLPSRPPPNLPAQLAPDDDLFA